MHTKGVIVVKDKDQEVPVEVLTKLVEQYPKVWGAGLFSVNSTSNKSEITMWTMDAKDGPIDLDSMVSDINVAFKDNPVVMYFGDHGDDYDSTNIPPWPIIDGDEGMEGQHLVLFATGDYPGYVRKDSTFSSAHHMMNEWLRPNAENLYEILGKDVGKLMLNYGKPVTQRDLEAQGDRDSMTMVLMASTDEVMVISNAKDKASFDWGFMSDGMGFGIDKPVEVKKEEPVDPKAAIKAKIAAAKAKAAAAGNLPITGAKNTDTTHVGKMQDSAVTLTAEQKAKVEAAKAATAPKSGGFAAIDRAAKPAASTSLTPMLDDTDVYGEPPAKCVSHGHLKSWYKEFAGLTPSNFKARPKVKILVNKVAKFRGESIGQKETGRSMADVGKVVAAAAATKPVTSSTHTPTPVSVPAIPAEPSKVEEPAAPSSPVIMPDPVQLIPIHERSRIITDVLPRLLDRASLEIQDPSKLRGMEAKWPTFSEATGIKLDDIYKWKDEDILGFCQQFPGATYKLVCTLLKDRYDLLNDLDLATRSISDAPREQKPQGKSGMQRKSA